MTTAFSAEVEVLASDDAAHLILSVTDLMAVRAAVQNRGLGADAVEEFDDGSRCCEILGAHSCRVTLVQNQRRSREPSVAYVEIRSRSDCFRRKPQDVPDAAQGV